MDDREMQDSLEDGDSTDFSVTLAFDDSRMAGEYHPISDVFIAKGEKEEKGHTYPITDTFVSLLCVQSSTAHSNTAKSLVAVLRCGGCDDVMVVDGTGENVRNG